MDPWESLANAVVLQAVEDYRMKENEEGWDELEDFFRSPWFGVLTALDPDRLILKLRKEKGTCGTYGHESISGTGAVSGHAD